MGTIDGFISRESTAQRKRTADFVVKFFQGFIQNLFAHQLSHHALKELLQFTVGSGFKQGSQFIVARLRISLCDEDLV